MSAQRSSDRIADLYSHEADSDLLACIRGDLENLTRAELAEGLREAARVTAGLMVMGEGLGVITYTILADTYRRGRRGKNRGGCVRSRRVAEESTPGRGILSFAGSPGSLPLEDGWTKRSDARTLHG